MRTRILLAAVAIGCTLALTAGPANASGGNPSTIVMELVPSGDASASCPGSLFGIAFDLTSTAGEPLGTGRSCIAAIDGCAPFRPLCHQTVTATFMLDLARGSVTVPMRLLEILPTADSFLQRGHGTVAGGTGAYSRVAGHVVGGGGGRFTEQGFEGRIVYALHVNGVR